MTEEKARTVGRPLKFKTPEALQKAIEDYLKVTDFDQYTVTGLALVIGSKQTLADYEKRDGYKEIVKIGKLHIENSYEISLRTKTHTPVGSIFALKNFGWSDKVDHEHSGGVEIIRIIDNIPHVEKDDPDYIRRKEEDNKD